MSKPDPPQPPNPIQTAGAQTSTNVSTAIANAFLNNVNQQTPLGALTYDPTDTFSWTDPVTAARYDIPRFTATQTLSPIEQLIQNRGEITKANLADIGQQQSGQLGNLLRQPFTLAGAPGAGDPNLLVSGIAPSPFIGDAGAITKTYGPNDYSADRANVEQALYGRINPQLDIEKQKLQQQLSDQGLRPGSPAYTAAMDQYARQANDARLAVTAQAGQEQQRMQQMAAQRAGFENQAQQQLFQQLTGRSTLLNATAQQQLQQEQAIIAAKDASRQQYLQELFAAQNQPINVVSALLSGSQVQQPNFITQPRYQIPTTDIAGLINQNFSQQFANYQQQNAQANQIIGGLFGLGTGALVGGYLPGGKSDRAVKENIHRVGTVFAGTPQPVQGVADVDGDELKNLPIYSYSYKDDPASTRHIGPMAQDVEKIDRSAVHEINGVKHIKPGRTYVIGSVLRAA
jgi:hypothetical protein